MVHFSCRVLLVLYFTVGYDNHDQIRPLFYPDTDIFLVCFSLEDRFSYTSVEERVSVICCACQFSFVKLAPLLHLYI